MEGEGRGDAFREQEPACGKRSPPRSSPSFVGDLPSLGNFDFSELAPAVLLTIHLDVGVSECLRPLAVPRLFGILTKSIEIWNRSSPKVSDSGPTHRHRPFAPPRVTCRASDLVPGSRCEPKSGLGSTLNSYAFDLCGEQWQRVQRVEKVIATIVPGSGDGDGKWPWVVLMLYPYLYSTKRLR